MESRGFSTGCALLLALSTGMASLAQSGPSANNNQRLRAAAHEKLPLAFEPNRGQAPSQVKFVAHSGPRSVFLTAGGTTLLLPGARSSERLALQLKLLGANSMAETVGVDPLPGQTNYFVGNDPQHWQAGIPQYARVKFRDIYKGVDLATTASNANWNTTSWWRLAATRTRSGSPWKAQLGCD
jgi:hypothetical protein